MDAFTSEKVFSAQIDSKGRITIPSEVRNILDLENGDEVTLSLPDTEVKEYTVKGPEEALKIVDETENIKDFEYSAGRLKVVIYG